MILVQGETNRPIERAYAYIVPLFITKATLHINRRKDGLFNKWSWVNGYALGKQN